MVYAKQNILLALILITVTPVSASNKTLVLAGSPLRYKNTFFNA